MGVYGKLREGQDDGAGGAGARLNGAKLKKNRTLTIFQNTNPTTAQTAAE